MAAKDLINLTRAKQAIQSITDSSQDTLLGVLITSISDAVAKYCRRDFVSKAYDELYSGTGDRRLLLREYPIQAVQSIRTRPATVLNITNLTAANVQARVSVLATGLELVRVNAGVKTTVTAGLDFAGNATLTALAAAVNAVGSGWSAQVVGDATTYGSWPSADLYVPPGRGDGTRGQGALSCVNGSFAELKLHTAELAGYQWDARGWLLRAIPYTDPELLHPEDLVWPVGINNLRIQYTAGYATVPEGVQEACARWVSLAWSMTSRDPLLTAQAVVGFVSQTWGSLTTNDYQPPAQVAALLQPYRRHTVATNQG
jgi:hypothetical protein